MSELQIPALGLAALIGIGVVVLLLALGFGAVCLHLATRLLKFKQRSLRKAFGTNLLMAFAPTVGSGGARLLIDFSETAMEPVWPYVVGAVMLAILGALFPILIIRHFYRQTFTKSLVAYVTTGVLEVAFGITMFLVLTAVVVALGHPVKSPGI